MTMRSPAGHAEEGPTRAWGPLSFPAGESRCGGWDQWPKVNQLTFTKSDGWPLVKVR
ncbi:hypothetical protein GCM10010415_18790 [Streptomyces atrovirens]